MITLNIRNVDAKAHWIKCPLLNNHMLFYAKRNRICFALRLPIVMAFYISFLKLQYASHETPCNQCRHHMRTWPNKLNPRIY